MKHRIILVGIALAAAWLPFPSAMVERVYSRALYPPIQRALTGASNLVPFALLDLFTLVVLGLGIVLGYRDVRRRSWPRALAAIAARTTAWAATLYLCFLCAWGLNYRRVRLVDRVAFDASRVSPERARDLALAAAGQVNALYGAAHADRAAASIDPALAAAFAAAQRDLGATWIAVPGRPKRTLLDAYFLRAGVDGMTDPFFLETLLASDLLPVERPFVVAHEWSHLAGVADEGEANFAGWLTCLRGAPLHRYSAWLFLLGELTHAVRGRDRVAIAAALEAGPRADLRAIAERIARHLSPRVATAGWRVYDQYLKANRVESGTASYAEVVKLVLGVELDASGAPILRVRR